MNKQIDTKHLESQVIHVLKNCYDPEIPVDIYELGLIYKIVVKEDATVEVDMTLTSPACPVAGSLPPEVEEKIKGISGVIDAKVNVVWDPTWNRDMMSEVAKFKLGFL